MNTLIHAIEPSKYSSTFNLSSILNKHSSILHFEFSSDASDNIQKKLPIFHNCYFSNVASNFKL